MALGGVATGSMNAQEAVTPEDSTLPTLHCQKSNILIAKNPAQARLLA